MAAASSSVCDPRNDRSGVNIHFVDEDELPLAHFVEHRVSEEEFYSDDSGSSDEESDESTSDEDMDEEIVAEAQDWSDEINQAPGARSADCNKLHKIQPFLDLIIPRFQQVYKPQWQLAIDETLIKFKGKVNFRQYLPMKAGRFGIKSFTLAESSTGYLLNSKIYTGKEGNVVERDLGKKAVLCVMEPFLDKGYYVFMDNYYTSVALFEELEERKTLACGTVRSNRSGLPKEICGIQEKKVKQLKRGESLYRQKGNVTCVTWRDRKPVSVLATIPTSDANRSAIQRSVKVSGTWEKRDFARPGVIDKYNTYMGGVDLSDQRAVSYARLMRGVVWYYKVFFYMWEVCLSNAHILHSKSPDHANITSFNFRKAVVKALVEGKCFRRDAGLPQIPVAIPEIRFNRDHFHHLISHDTRSTCKVHIQEVKTSYTCAICGVRMCIEPCFKRYHTMQDYYFDDSRYGGSRRLKEREGRPFRRGRRRSLRN